MKRPNQPFIDILQRVENLLNAPTDKNIKEATRLINFLKGGLYEQ